MKTARTTEAFENVRDQIGFCGIWCGSCVVGNGTLRELTRKYAEILKKYDVGEWGPKDFDFEEFSRGLISLQNMDVCPGCLRGGGRDACEIKACASGKRIHDCTECPEPASCQHTGILEKMRSGALDAGLSVKTEASNDIQLIEKWTAELKNGWPCCVLFTDGG